MSLSIKDSTGTAKTLKTTLDGSDHVTHHHVDTSGLPTGAATDAVQKHSQATLATSAARTATFTSATQSNLQYRGVQVVLDVTAFANTPEILISIEGVDPTSGKSYNILTSESISTDWVGTYVFTVYPGIAAVTNRSVSAIIPTSWLVNVAHTDADSITYSIGAHMMK